MQFLLIARDGEDAAERRAALRDRHLAVANRLFASGNLLYGVAMLDDKGQPCGSMEVVEFKSRTELDEWLEQEPFVTGQVWARVDVMPCRTGPMFSKP